MRIPERWDGPWAHLAAAILLRAAKDAQGRQWRTDWGPGSPDGARAWLTSEQARRIADELGMAEALERWLGQGCPRRRRKRK